MSDEELRKLFVKLAIGQDRLEASQMKTDEQLRKTDEQLRKTNEQLQKLEASQAKTDEQLQETNRIVKELSINIGGLTNKFGSFTESLAFPSLKRIVQQHLQIENVYTRHLIRKNRDSIELDLFGYTNSQLNRMVVAEIKSKARERELQFIEKKMKRVRKFLPEHANKELWAMVVFLDTEQEVKKKAMKQGWYVADLQNELFELLFPPAGFQPKQY